MASSPSNVNSSDPPQRIGSCTTSQPSTSILFSTRSRLTSKKTSLSFVIVKTLPTSSPSISNSRVISPSRTLSLNSPAELVVSLATLSSFRSAITLIPETPGPPITSTTVPLIMLLSAPPSLPQLTKPVSTHSALPHPCVDDINTSRAKGNNTLFNIFIYTITFRE